MSKPLVTILIPVRQPHRAYLELALGSLIEQEAHCWEGILITDDDDGSLADLTISDSRLSRVVSASRGLSCALNAGMRATRTPFAGILLGDDQLDTKAIAIVERYIQLHPAVDFFHSSLSYIDAQERPLLDIRPSRPVHAANDFLEHAVTHFMCWKVSMALRMGGIDESFGLHGADDYDFPWSMWEAGATFMNLPEVLYRYRIHTDHFRLTTHVPRHIQVEELKRIFLKHGLKKEQIDEEISRRSNDYLWQAIYP